VNMKTITFAALAGLFVSFLCGCDEDKYTLKFSHHLHVTENEMSCDECHGELGEPSFSALSHDTCSDCHDESEAKEVRKNTCGYCHVGELLQVLKARKVDPKPPRKTTFVHTEALDGRCAECHESIMDEELTSVPRLKRNDILEIRDAAHRSGEDCLACHVDMDPYQAPADHNHIWMKRHGIFGVQENASCSVCHSEDSCRECHSVMEPISHNNLWRLRTHGVNASWDRQSCMVCHETDSCVACHSQARPRSHRARWSQNHCYGCHTDASPGEGCVVCHEEGNNVLLHQDFWPPVHDRFGNQANCYDCHNPFDK
jgi:hypothetical protein